MKATKTVKTTPVSVPAPAVVPAQGKIIDNSKQIADLLTELRGATMSAAKKQIRRRLRKLGHRGGLNRKRVVATTPVVIA